VDKIEMNLRGIWCGGVEWIDLAQDKNQWMAVIKTLMNFQVP
jgi:hypothetical protein